MNRFFLKKNYLNYIVLASLVFVAYFFGRNQLGFYEDDYAQITPYYFDKNYANLINIFRWSFQYFPQGRPLNPVVVTLLAMIGSNIGGVAGLFAIVAAILWINSILVYTFCARYFSNQAALFGAAVFIVFPIDTTRLLIHATFQLQISFLLILIGLNIYHTKLSWLAYCFGVCSLLIYEAPIIFLFFLPALDLIRNSKVSIIRCLRHVLILSLILGLYLYVRSFFGETRLLQITSLKISELIFRVISAPFYGFYTGLEGIKNSIQVGFSGIDNWEEVFIFLFVFSLSVIRKNDNVRLSFDKLSLLKCVTISFILILASYATAIANDHYPPTILNGRMTSVHYSASLGWGFLFATVFDHIRFKSRIFRLLFQIALIMLFASFLGSQRLIRSDLAEAWLEQKIFWKETISLLSDIGPGEIVFFEPNQAQLRGDRNIYPMSWSTVAVLSSIFEKNQNWSEMPKVIISKHIDDISLTEKFLKFHIYYLDINVPLDRVSILKYVDGKLVRDEGPIRIGGLQIYGHLSDGVQRLSKLRALPFYSVLIDPN